MEVIPITKRTNSFVLRLSDQEMARLNRAVGRTNLSREGYVRRILSGYEPQPAPPQEYWDYVRQLWAICNGIDDILCTSDELSHETRGRLISLKKQLAETTGKLQSISTPKKKQ